MLIAYQMTWIFLIWLYRPSNKLLISEPLNSDIYIIVYTQTLHFS